jgi:outer membrane protein
VQKIREVEMVKRVMFVVGVLLFLLNGSPKAEEVVRIAYVDMDRVFGEYVETQKASQELNKEITARRQEITKLENEINTLKEELSTQEILLSKEEKLKRTQEINQKILDLQKYVRDVDIDLSRKEESMTKKLITEILSAVKKVGEKEEYTLVLRKDSLLYSKEDMDLTDEVIKVLNKGR